jgi:hypothetical protein
MAVQRGCPGIKSNCRSGCSRHEGADNTMTIGNSGIGVARMPIIRLLDSLLWPIDAMLKPGHDVMCAAHRESGLLALMITIMIMMIIITILTMTMTMPMTTTMTMIMIMITIMIMIMIVVVIIIIAMLVIIIIIIIITILITIITRFQSGE